MLKIIPFADTAITGNSVTFTPNTTPLYSLTDDDLFIRPAKTRSWSREPTPIRSRIGLALEIRGRSDAYNTGPVTTFDQSMIDRFGLRVGSTIAAHEICDVTMAKAPPAS